MPKYVLIFLVPMFSACLLPTVDFGDTDEPSLQRDLSDPQLLDQGYAVTTIKDGDTVGVLVASVEEIIRFKGLNTPELGEMPEPCAIAAKNYTSQNIGTQVTLRFDSSCSDEPFLNCRDIFGRLLAGITTSRDTDLGSELIALGLAQVFAFDDENFDGRTEYEALQAQAQADNLGIWGSPQCPSSL